ncbi:DUF1330 domain-containing protein [Phenylobacterium sp.]|jgi:uncharacterized protein (DUF1330 family)|uniref:DUF1330 domain-containing protein n=1 Tax=Phenylobacterium sp. TaxID=1871053 RepID=UPI0035AF2493
MSAYLIAFVEVHDEARYGAEYVPAMNACLAPFCGRYRALRAQMHPREGAFPDGKVVLIEFPSMAQAERWYASEAYAPLLEVRREIATTTLGFFSAGPGTQQQSKQGGL